MNLPTGARSLRVVLAMLVLTAVSCAVANQTDRTQAKPDETPTPQRVDGRVEPTINPKRPSYDTPAARAALIDAANKLRNERLAKYPTPVTTCTRVEDGAIEVDGALDDAAWRGVALVTNFRDTRAGTASKLKTEVRLAWDSKYLYIAFDCEDGDLVAKHEGHDDALWEHDVAEVFLDADADEMSYLEFELAPNGALYDGAIAEYRPEVTWDVNAGHLDMDKTIRIYDTADTRTAVRVRGTVNDSTDEDEGYSCEMAISWQDIRRGTNVDDGGLPPRDGDVWRMGLYRCNFNDRKDAVSEYTAWNPTGTWFHVPYCFGRVVFVK